MARNPTLVSVTHANYKRCWSIYHALGKQILKCCWTINQLHCAPCASMCHNRSFSYSGCKYVRPNDPPYVSAGNRACAAALKHVETYPYAIKFHIIVTVYHNNTDDILFCFNFGTKSSLQCLLSVT